MSFALIAEVLTVQEGRASSLDLSPEKRRKLETNKLLESVLGWKMTIKSPTFPQENNDDLSWLRFASMMDKILCNTDVCVPSWWPAPAQHLGDGKRDVDLGAGHHS